GIKRVKEIIDAAIEVNIKSITLYVFSMENWNRPSSEVNALLRLFEWYLKRNMQELIDKNVRFRAIGEISLFSSSIQKLIRQFEENSSKNTGLLLVGAMSYSSRSEIIRAIRKLSQNRVDMNKLTEDTFCQYLDTAGIPDPDLIIRTSGEIRLSNFLLWQAAYAELYFTEDCWPDFTKEKLLQALKEYEHRERRFGKVP
ncbi:MAG TPA: polyprenyl diphosphate synthase, partial [Thermodesulfovibrionia bacterium]|nr:polyprenyl diphosphate synthase [Thermodesulfovibrionia bacterium]